MEINSKSLSLFNYIGDNNKSNEVLQSLAKSNDRDIGVGLDVLENGLNKGRFEETFKLLEKGEIDIDLNLVGNYHQFNQQKLDKEIAHLAKSFDLSSEAVVTLQDGKLVVEKGYNDDNHADALQQYFDKDTSLNSLVQQTGKLSQFVEWGEAKQQAAQYKSEDMPEEQLVGFLKEARSVVTQNNQFIMSDKGSAFSSQGHTKFLIDKFIPKQVVR
jgi:hypothetical protein